MALLEDMFRPLSLGPAPMVASTAVTETPGVTTGWGFIFGLYKHITL